MDSGPREGPILLVFLILTLGATGFVLHRAQENTVKDPKQKAARGEIQGLSQDSLVRPENLQKALAKISASKYPLVWNIRVAPDRVNASVRDRDGYRRFMTIDPGFGVKTTDAGVGDDYAIAASQIDVGAPKRMLGAVVEKTGLSPAAVDYAATSFSKDTPTLWYMAMKQGPARVRQWVAAEDGSDVRHPGELSAADKEKQAHVLLMNKRRAACLQKAHDAEAAAKCVEKYQ